MFYIDSNISNHWKIFFMQFNAQVAKGHVFRYIQIISLSLSRFSIYYIFFNFVHNNSIFQMFIRYYYLKKNYYKCICSSFAMKKKGIIVWIKKLILKIVLILNLATGQWIICYILYLLYNIHIHIYYLICILL